MSSGRSETRTFAATLISDTEIERSPTLRVLLDAENRPDQVAIVLVGNADRRESLLVDLPYLRFARRCESFDPALLNDLDLPRKAVVARVTGWPDTWDDQDLPHRQRRRVEGVWEFESDSD